jgi:hypothetical protein
MFLLFSRLNLGMVESLIGLFAENNYLAARKEESGI